MSLPGSLPSDSGPVRYETFNGEPCPRTRRVDGTVEGEGSCHLCAAETSCPFNDPWSHDLLD